MVIVLSTLCTHVLSDLSLEIEAGVPTQISDEFRSRVLDLPGVVEIHTAPAPATNIPEED